jgi:tetratricopeptide (TPR) repeat protein
MMSKIFAALLAASLLACATEKKPQPTTFSINQQDSPDFDRGVKLLEREDYSAAADIFDHLLVAKPASELDLMTSFNSGAAHEGMGECNHAAERYREVVRSSAGKFSRLEAQALFRLSLMYECMGQDMKTITALLDARKRAKDLAPEISRAELPARLAAAYSRLGNHEKAVQYFSQASDGLKIILADGSASKKQKETLGRTLYFMGRLNPAQRSAEGDGIAFLQSLSMQQPYLLQAVELAPPQWARKASEDMSTAYDNILRYNPQTQERRHAYYVRALQVIAELRKIRMPDAGPEEDAIFRQVDKTERHIQTELAAVAATTTLTPEAQKREGLRREGRPVDPGTKKVKKP